jgi:transposase
MIMSMATTTRVVDDGAMSALRPRAGGPRPRRSFTPAQKMHHLQAYEQACAAGDGGGYLRREGLYSSLITTWRTARDSGLLTATSEHRVGRPSAEQAEIARLRRRLEVTEARLATTETALDIMGKARELLETISKSSDTESRGGQR